MNLSRVELKEMGQVEFRVIAETPDEVKKWLDFLQLQFPHSITSPVKGNDARPGYRGYVTVFEVEEPPT
jgi:hypothetical protein